MLRTQAKKQGGFYVCASCRRQHQQNLVHLRPQARIPSDALLPASRYLSSNALATPTSICPATRRTRSGTARDCQVPPSLTKTILARSNRRDYSAWGKFGSNALPGQSNSAWGAALKNAQAAGTRNPPPSPSTSPSPSPSPSPAWGASTSGAKIPTATGTSAWDAARTGGGISPTSSTSPTSEGRFGSGFSPPQQTPGGRDAARGVSKPPAPSQARPGSQSSNNGSFSEPSFSAPQGSTPLHPLRTQRSNPALSSAPKQPGSTPLFIPTLRSSQMGTDTPGSRPQTTHSNGRLPSQQPAAHSQSSPVEPLSGWLRGEAAETPQSGTASSMSPPRPERQASCARGSQNNTTSSNSQDYSTWRTSAPGFGSFIGPSKPGPSATPAFGQQNTPWTNGYSNTFNGPSGMVPGKPAFGASATTPGKPAFGTSGTIPGNPAFESNDTSSGQPAFEAPGRPAAQFADGTLAAAPDQTNSAVDAMTSLLKEQSIQEDTSPHSPFPRIQRASSDPQRRSAVSGSQRSSNDLLDNSFHTRPPSREAPRGAEFPQLRRRGSREELFESMSPFNLPPKGSSPPQDPGARPRASPRALPFRLRIDKYDRYPDWGSPKDLGKVAPDPVAPAPSPRSYSGEDRRQPSQYQNEVNSPFPSIKGLERPPPSQRRESQFTSHEHSAAAARGDMAEYDVYGQDLPQRDPQRSEEPQQYSQYGQKMPKFDGPPPPSEPRDSDRSARLYDDRRRKNREFERDGLDAYQGEYQELDRRGKEGKSKKKAKNQRRGAHDDERNEGHDYEEAMALRAQRRRYQEAKRAAKEDSAPKTILLPEYISVYDLAEALRVKPAQFLEDLEQLGFENILIDSVMTGETAALVAAEYGFDPKIDSGNDVDLKPRPPPEDLSALPPRPPIVTIMGHVDHGKTTILDFLRKSSIAAGEHGGITQHIGAFSVKLSTGKAITFLDTPGHAAFLSMRQRGANVTDIVVLVVAVDDSVMPQTIEAIKHAQSAKVPIIVAINKIDVDPNRVDVVQRDLDDNGVRVEDLGGDIQAVAISGKTGQGMKDLEEAILTLSEIMDVRAETDGMAEGWVLETSVKQDGKAATILVKRGTLRVGDLIVAGNTYTKIRVMKNEAGANVEEAFPSTPVEVYGGWREPPMAGDMVLQAPDETRAQAAVDYRQEIAERALSAAQKAQQELNNREKAEREALKKMMEEEGEEERSEAPTEPEDSGPKRVNIIVKGDVMGSVEAVCGALEEIGNNEVRPHVLRSSPGQITESDVDLIAMAKGCIVNFNNPIPGFIQTRAELAGVKILDHNIIYEVVTDVKDQLSQQLAPTISQRVLAEAEVLQVFAINITKRLHKNIAGVKIRTGAVTRGGLYRVMREGEKIHEGKLEALKQGKKDVSEMRKGTECGMMFGEFDDFQTGDIIQLFENVEEKRYV